MKHEPDTFRLPLVGMRWAARAKLQMRLHLIFLRKLFTPQSAGYGLRLAGATLSICALVVTGAWGGYSYVSTSNNIIRGDLLYGIKRDIERRELAQTTDPASRSLFFLTLADKRMAEAAVAVQRSTTVTSIFTIPTAYAADETRTTLSSAKTLNVGDSIAAGLVAEGAQFVSLSLTEAGKVKTSAIVTPLLQQIDTRMQAFAAPLQRIASTSTEPEVQTTATSVQKVFVANTKLIDKAETVIARDKDGILDDFDFAPWEWDFETEDNNDELLLEWAAIEAFEEVWDAEEAEFEENVEEFLTHVDELAWEVYEHSDEIAEEELDELKEWTWEENEELAEELERYLDEWEDEYWEDDWDAYEDDENESWEDEDEEWFEEDEFSGEQDEWLEGEEAWAEEELRWLDEDEDGEEWLDEDEDEEELLMDEEWENEENTEGEWEEDEDAYPYDEEYDHEYGEYEKEERYEEELDEDLEIDEEDVASEEIDTAEEDIPTTEEEHLEEEIDEEFNEELERKRGEEELNDEGEYLDDETQEDIDDEEELAGEEHKEE